MKTPPDCYRYSCDGCGAAKFVSKVEVRAMRYPFTTVQCCGQPMKREAKQGHYGPMCMDPDLCAGKGYCPRDPTCAD